MHAGGSPGLTYRLHTASVFDQYQRDVIRMVPQSRLGAPRRKSEQERLDQHTYAVVAGAGMGVNVHTAHVKLQYVQRQLLAELGLAQVVGEDGKREEKLKSVGNGKYIGAGQVEKMGVFPFTK